MLRQETIDKIREALRQLVEKDPETAPAARCLMVDVERESGIAKPHEVCISIDGKEYRYTVASMHSVETIQQRVTSGLFALQGVSIRRDN